MVIVHLCHKGAELFDVYGADEAFVSPLVNDLTSLQALRLELRPELHTDAPPLPHLCYLHHAQEQR